ncbi:hypothetical protein F0L74_00205 [Chitinophaga agrisoli]|uniref:Uncharacterized protein n=1 Tax=Chitinophaga agrisoli TaxID=2607653 RepID=A0A5B2VZH8_9BACT|nr:hypothetical protein [Chitinophaga agrisoli]KAA2244445.1 hypothetical protein F0L74_00205 [Chitinophaga agrisoli]
MNNPKLTYTAALVLSVALFIIGQTFFDSIFTFFEPHIDGISFQITELGAIVKTSILFSLLLALIPLLLVLTWRSGKIHSTGKRIASVITVLLFISLAIFIRQYFVKMYFTRIVKPALLTSDNTTIGYPIDPVNFVYYMCGGLLLGLILAYFMFRNKAKVTAF